MSIEAVMRGVGILGMIGLGFVLACLALAWPFSALSAGTENHLLYEDASPDGRYVLSVSVTTTRSQPRYFLTVSLRRSSEKFDFEKNERLFGIQNSTIMDPRWESPNRILIRYQGAVAKKSDGKVGEIEVETRRVALAIDDGP
jgi:hypothetical protein